MELVRLKWPTTFNEELSLLEKEMPKDIYRFRPEVRGDPKEGYIL